MFALPVGFLVKNKFERERKKIYRKTKHIESELLSVDFTVKTIITYKELVKYDEVITIENSTITIKQKPVIVPEKKYGFLMKIRLSAGEYRKNKRDICNYVLKKAVNSIQYNAKMEEISETDGRKNPVVENFVFDQEFNFSRHEYEQYEEL